MHAEVDLGTLVCGSGETFRKSMNKREFLAASIGLGLTGAQCFAQDVSAEPARPGGRQSARIPTRKAKSTKLFRSPDGFPNGIAVTPEGLWIGEQKLSGAVAAAYHMSEPKSLTEAAWLVDWKGKLLKTVSTPSRNTSGMAVGGGFVWMGANAPPEGIFQVDMNSRVVSHRQIPLGTPTDGGGCHGLMWNEGKLWIVANRLKGILRVDPTTW